MSAGSSPAGTGGAGLYIPVRGVQFVKAPPQALRFEGEVKDWVLDVNGNYRSVTPTEQGMIISICFNQNQIKSSPEIGNTLDQIVYLGARNLRADVENRVRNANPARALIAAGKAAIRNIVIDTSTKSLIVQVFFQALDAPNSPLLNRAWSN